MGQKASWIRGSVLGAAALLALVLGVMVNYLATRYYQRLDWTASDRYTLSARTHALLDTVDRNLDILVFLKPRSDEYESVLALLRSYVAASPRITMQTIDPLLHPEIARELGERYLVNNALVVTTGERGRVIHAADLMEPDFSAGSLRVSAFKLEAALSSAVLELVEQRKLKLVYTLGHGEQDPRDTSPVGQSHWWRRLEYDNFDIAPWPSRQQPEVPEGTDLVVLSGPRTPFQEAELGALGEYLDQGGNMLLLLDPEIGDPPGAGRGTGLAEWLGGYGVEAVTDLVVDPPLTFSPTSPFAFNGEAYADHPITWSLYLDRELLFFSRARSITAGGDRVMELVRTSSEGWGERNPDDLLAPRRDRDDTPGPVSLAVAVEQPRIVVIGSAATAANEFFTQGYNAAFLNNAVNWLVERDTLMGVPPRPPQDNTLHLTSREALSLSLFLILGLPLAVVVAGVVVWRRRRR